MCGIAGRPQKRIDYRLFIPARRLLSEPWSYPRWHQKVPAMNIDASGDAPTECATPAAKTSPAK